MGETGIATKPQRNYGLDLLRMVAMFMIVVIHVLDKGNVIGSAEKFSLNHGIANFMYMLVYCAVNCYALISGYFAATSKYRYSSLAALWLRVAFYSVTVTVIVMIAMPELFSIKQLVFSFLPVSTKRYWYFTAYFALFIISPLINVAVNKLTKKQLKYISILLIFTLSVLSLVTRNDVFSLYAGYSPLWLIALYIVGAYIGKYNAFENVTKPKAFLGYLLFSAITWGVKYIIETTSISIVSENVLRSYISPTMVGSAVCLLILFRQLSLKGFIQKIVVFCAPLCFSVYLIHTHYLVYHNILLNRFESLASLSAPLMVLAVIGVSLGIFVVCILIDAVREAISKKLKIKKRLANFEDKHFNIWSDSEE